jgi:hypothetical protein
LPPLDCSPTSERFLFLITILSSCFQFLRVEN